MNPHQQAARHDAPPLAEYAETYWHFAVKGGSELSYDRICDQIGFPRRIAPGLLGHFAGPYEKGWELIDLWTDGESMERVFSDHLIEAISAVTHNHGERFDVEPEVYEIGRVIVGPAARRFTPEAGALAKCSERGVRPVAVFFEHLGGGESEYLSGCDLLGFPGRIPEGLIVHVAGGTSEGWRVVDVWESAAHADAWNAEVRTTIAAIDAGSGLMSSARFRQIELVRAFVMPELSGGGQLAP